MSLVELVLRGTLMYWRFWIVLRLVVKREAGAVSVTDLKHPCVSLQFRKEVPQSTLFCSADTIFLTGPRRKRELCWTLFTSPFGVPCWIFCGSGPSRTPFCLNAYVARSPHNCAFSNHLQPLASSLSPPASASLHLPPSASALILELVPKHVIELLDLRADVAAAIRLAAIEFEVILVVLLR